MKQLCTLAFLFASLSCHAVSFDCAKATTPQEKAICAKPELSQADDQLAEAYKAVLAQVPPEFATGVRDDQRAWVRGVSPGCPATGKNAVENLSECLLGSYQIRTAQLKKLVQQQGGVTFVWRTITRSAKDKPDPDAEPCQQATVPGSSTLTAFWPQPVSDKEEWKSWSQALEAAVRKINRSDTPEPITSWEQALNGSQDSDSDITVTLRSVSSRLVTVSIENLQMGHCAPYPNSSAMQLNWLLPEAREVKADDLFRRASGWEKTLETACRSALIPQIRKNGGTIKGNELLESLATIVRDPHNWLLDAKGLSIVFSDDNASPHAAVPDPIIIPWSGLKVLLQAGFEPPR